MAISLDLQLHNKVVLITGSTKGIGFSIAQVLHSESCNVILNGRNSIALEEALIKLPGSLGIAADVTQPEDAERLVAEVMTKFGRLDALVCNVGSGRSVSPGNECLKEWQRVISINLWSTTNMVEAATYALSCSHGSIVCISSICGHEVVPGAPITYSAAKAALNAYVRGISRPLGKRGVRINAIAPGNIIFDQSVWSKKIKEDPGAVAEMLVRDVALDKLGLPSDVADLTAFLLSPVSNFATGAVWTIDGGQVRS